MEKQYIDKNAITEEIERLIKSPILYKSENVETRINALEYLLSFIDTLEVKELEVKEVDLDEEIRKWQQKHFEGIGYVLNGSGGWIGRTSLIDIAEHFFELGLNTLHRR